MTTVISSLLNDSLRGELAVLAIASFSFDPSLFWLVAGGILCLVEVVVPTAFTAVMMGISALIVALLTRFFPAQMGLQIALWMGFSTAFVYLAHRMVPKGKVSSIEDASEGKTITEILPGQTGRVLYEGNSWRARCGEPEQAIAPDQKVYVVGRQGTTLIVMPDSLSDA
jgi:membrane protein implicated in regulation of membrane protease activity